MLARLLLGVLALGIPDESRNWLNEENAFAPKEGVPWSDIQNASKLHVGMLTISLIVCLAYGGFVAFTYWTQKNILLSHVRNLIIAFFCRIFFAVIFDGVVVLEANTSVGGANTLLAFECISQNLVFAFWLMLTLYLHAQVQRKFCSEPTLDLYEYGIPGVAVFFAFVWIFVLQSEYPHFVWWGFVSCVPQWIVGSLKLLYLLIQLGLVADMARIIKKISMDNDSLTLLRKTSAVLLALVFLFWLQFGLSLGRLSKGSTSSLLHFDYFIDGSQGALVCLGLFFLQKWVPLLFSKTPSLMTQSEGLPNPRAETLLPGNRGIVTIDKVFMTNESGRWKDSDAAEESRDVVYSSVVEPHRLKKTLELYKRLNVLPSSQVTVLEGEEYFDCPARDSMISSDSEKLDFHSIISEGPKTPPRRIRSLKPTKLSEQIQKKNAFYASKYLIVDSKEKEFPKLLETRPTVPSAGKESLREEAPNREIFSSLGTLVSDELVEKWLNDYSDNLQKQKQPEIQQSYQEQAPEPASVDTPGLKAVSTTSGEIQTKKTSKNSAQTLTEIKIIDDFPSAFNNKFHQTYDQIDVHETSYHDHPKPEGSEPLEQILKHLNDAELADSYNKPETSNSTETTPEREQQLLKKPTTSKVTEDESINETIEELSRPVKIKRQAIALSERDCKTIERKTENQENIQDSAMDLCREEPETMSEARQPESTNLKEKHSDTDSHEKESNYRPMKDAKGVEDESTSLNEESVEVPDELQEKNLDQMQIDLTAAAVLIPPVNTEENSSSEFSIESSSPGSPFSLNEYYSGLKNSHGKVHQHPHPYARQPKRAKLSDRD